MFTVILPKNLNNECTAEDKKLTVINFQTQIWQHNVAIFFPLKDIFIVTFLNGSYNHIAGCQKEKAETLRLWYRHVQHFEYHYIGRHNLASCCIHPSSILSASIIPMKILLRLSPIKRRVKGSSSTKCSTIDSQIIPSKFLHPIW